MIKLMIVDDSGFMRLAIKKMLEKNAAIEVVAEASSAEEAVRLAKQHRPHVITMDIEMPGGSGLDATRIIMKECPTVIIMVSSITTLGAESTLKALEYGAVDYIPKASSFVNLDITKIEQDLLRKIFYWVEHRKNLLHLQTSSTKTPAVTTIAPRFDIKPRLIVIGASTGGPKIIPELFKKVNKIKAPIVIAIHMPPIYTESFARHLANSTGHRVVEGEDKMVLEEGMVVVLPGGKDTQIESNGDHTFRLKVSKPLEEYSIHPSVNCLFKSAIKETKKVAAIVLTGMGDDGLEGAMEFKKYGLPVIAQDQESSLVYGMPRAVAESGLATASLNIAGISNKINSWAS